MDQLIIWEFTDGSVLVTTTDKEAAMKLEYSDSGWDFEGEADRRLIVGNAVELSSAIKLAA